MGMTACYHASVVRLLLWVAVGSSVLFAVQPFLALGHASEPVDATLRVETYAPGEGGPGFKWPTHIAFGPGDTEVVTDLRNNRLVYRAGPDQVWRVSPLKLKGPHSVVYNPVDGLYYANDTDHHRLIAFKDLAKPDIHAETRRMLGIDFHRIHDVVLDPETHWLYAINPHSGHVFRFKAIGREESKLDLADKLGGYARSLTFVDGKLFVIGSVGGRIIEVLDWDKQQVKVYQSPGKKNSRWGGGAWDKTGLILNDADYFDGHWYATCYFAKHYTKGTDIDYDRNKFIRFKTLDDFAEGRWEDLSHLLPSDRVPYYLTPRGDALFLGIFNQSEPGKGDAILKLSKPERGRVE